MEAKLTSAQLAAQTIKKKHGDDFYQTNGRLGGLAGGGKAGFHTQSKEKHLASSAKGGSRPKSEETRAKMKAAWVLRKQREASNA